MPEHVYIAIEGPIGVGKTTLARRLQAVFGAETLLEVFEENPFLSDFYADRQRFAFQTQIFFLLSRYRQQREVQHAGRLSLISDYIFAKDRLFAHLNLHGDELETYERLHSALAERIRLPDLVLYLRASPEVLMERIATRDRPYERSMSADYIVALARAYEQFFATYQDTRLLVVDTDRLNVVRNAADLESVVSRIRMILASGRHAAHEARPEHLQPAAEAPAAPAGAAAEASSAGAQAFMELYLEFLGFQRAVGEVASALLRGWTPDRLSRVPEPDLPLLGEALLACEAALHGLRKRAGTAH